MPGDDEAPAEHPAVALGDATVDLIASMEPGDFLAAVTPERLGEASGYSASSVRYRLTQAGTGGATASAPTSKRWNFDREVLLKVTVDAMFARLKAASEQAAAVYLDAVRELHATGDFGAFSAALTKEAQQFSPGGTVTDRAAAADRTRLLTLVASETGSALTRQFRDEHEGWLGIYLPVYELLFEVTGRRPRQGLTTTDVAIEISMYLQGLGERRRFEPLLDQLAITRSAVALFCTWTERADGAPEFDAVGAFLAELASGQPNRAT